MNRFGNYPWVNAALFEDVRDGETLAAILQSKGYEARVYFDKLLQTFLFLCPPCAMFRVQVRANDFKGALEFLGKQIEVTPILERAILCPACGSLRVNYPQMTRKFLLPTLVLHLGIIFRVIEHEAYCEHCHHTWNLPKVESPQLANAPRPIH